MHELVAEPDDARVLIVDDHAPNLDALQVVIEPLGMPIVRASSGKDALHAILAQEFAVILLDVMMPELDGFETAKLIRGRRRSATIPIIFVTANSLDREDALRGYDVGAADYVMKPYDPTILRAKVGVFLELHRARRLLDRQDAALARANAYRMLAERIPQQVWSATADGLLDYVNPVVVEYFGQPAATLLGTGWLALVHPDDAAEAKARWTTAVRDGSPYDIEFRLRHRDGRYRWHLVRATPDREGEGTVVRWLGTNTDIDDRKRVEAELLAAVRTRDNVLATVSHDLRGPLNALLLASETLAATPEAITRHQQFVQRSVKKMDRLILDLLDMASIESGNLSLEPKPVSVEEVVAEALESIQPLAAAKSLRLTSELAARELMLADRVRLLQVFSNLLGNAVKFTPGAGQISVRAACVESNIRFEVSDTGPGLEPDQAPYVFERFWQARPTARAGTGLGLAISKGIVQQHGGSIWVESRVGAGTTFFFTIPLALS